MMRDHKLLKTSLQQQGWTLVELLIALLVFSIGVTALLKIQIMAIHTQQDAWLRSVAVTRVQTLAEQLQQGMQHVNLSHWNRVNHQLLPHSHGRLRKEGSHYLISLQWKSDQKLMMRVAA